MYKLKDYNLNAFLLLLLGFLILLILTAGCTSSKQVNRWLQEKPKEQTEPVVKAYLSLNELFAATWCDEKYPVQESTETKTDTLKVPVLIKGDSIPCPEVTDAKTGQKYTPMVKCPDVSYYQTTISTLEKTTKESSAKADRYRLEGEEKDKEIAALETALKEKDEKLAATQEKLENRNTLLLWIIGIAVALLIGLKFMLRR